jgi:hypothetical protein
MPENNDMRYTLHVLGELKIKLRGDYGREWSSILYVSRETCTCCGPKADNEVAQTICLMCAETWNADHKIKTNNDTFMTAIAVRSMISRSIIENDRRRTAPRNQADVHIVAGPAGPDSNPVVTCDCGPGVAVGMTDDFGLKEFLLTADSAALDPTSEPMQAYRAARAEGASADMAGARALQVYRAIHSADDEAHIGDDGAESIDDMRKALNERNRIAIETGPYRA